MASTKCLILVPLGPNFPLAFVQDTINSFNHYMPAEDCEIWLMDDTCQITGVTSSDIPLRYVRSDEVFPWPSRAGIWNTYGPLSLKLLRTMAAARTEFDFDLVLRIDTDAIVTGPSPHLDAASQFAADPQIAIIGALTKRGDGTDKTVAMRAAGEKLTIEMGLRRMVIDLVKRHVPVSRTRQLRWLGRSARRNVHYTMGDTCTGGAVFISRKAVDRFLALGFHEMSGLRYSSCPEDWIFGLFSAAAGMRLSDDQSQTMSINWRGLPCPPEEVVERGVKVFHPVKLDDPDAQGRIRGVFEGLRAA